MVLGLADMVADLAPNADDRADCDVAEKGDSSKRIFFLGMPMANKAVLFAFSCRSWNIILSEHFKRDWLRGCP